MVKQTLTLLLFIILFICFKPAYAQKDTVLSVPEVTVYGNRLDEFNAGVKVQESDSLRKQNFRTTNLSNYLEQNSTIYIKSYGLGSLSTTAFRGAGASQTSVLWNGFNLQSPMNGTLDLALIPVSLVDQVKVQFGGCGALWGSGSVAGSIHLDNKPYYGKGLSIQYGGGYGSFQNLSQQASVSLSQKKWIVAVRGFWSDAKNNFPFTNTTQFGEPKVSQTNASVKQYGYLLDTYFKLSRRDQISIRLWQQYSDREIPPTMLVNFSDAVQKDWFVRFSTEWQHSRKKATYNIRVAYFDENLLYQEQSKAIDSYSHSRCLISEAETKIKILKRGVYNVGFNNTYSTAEVDAYIGIPYQNRSAMFSSLKYSGKDERWKTNIGMRKEIVVGSRYTNYLEVPIMPFAGIDWRIVKKLTFKITASRNYRLPTFNDLYWTPGGNINLQPEQGWTEEAGLHFVHRDLACTGEHCSGKGKKLALISLSSTFFNRNIDNWIMWVPDGNYWIPKNILKVWSRGLENTADLVLNFHPLQINAGGRYDYTISTNEKVAPGNQNELYKQLIYVPIYKAMIYGGISWKGYAVRYSHQYTGWVFTQADNASYIDPYWIGNITVSKTYEKNYGSVSLFFKVNNVTNKAYQVIAYRAMPGRNFEIGMSIQYKHKTDKNK